MFDPVTIRYHATYEQPIRIAEGVRHVPGKRALRVASKNNIELRLVAAGWLQAHGKWASITARVQMNQTAAERTTLIMLNRGNPMNPQATVRVPSEGARVQNQGREIMFAYEHFTLSHNYKEQQ